MLVVSPSMVLGHSLVSLQPQLPNSPSVGEKLLGCSLMTAMVLNGCGDLLVSSEICPKRKLHKEETGLWGGLGTEAPVGP